MASLVEQLDGRTHVVGEVFAGGLGEEERLTGVELVDCTFRDASWAGSTLAGVHLDGCRFERVDLSRVRLPDSVVDGCTFTGCKALATSWAMQRSPVIAPDPSRWVDCQLSLGGFGGLDLTGAAFERCVLDEADFDGAVLREVVFDECSLAGARLVRADLRDADLRSARDYVVDARETRVEGLRVDQAGALGLLTPFGVVVG